MKLTKEQKRENVRRAIELRKQANKLIAEAEKLMEDSGIKLINAQTRHFDSGKTEIHVYTGIFELANLFDLKPGAYLDCFGEPRKGTKAVEIDGTIFFQLGEAADSKDCFK